MSKAGNVLDSEGSGRTREGTVSIRRNLKLAAPAALQGEEQVEKRRRPRTEPWETAAHKEREPPEENEAVAAPTSSSGSLEPSFP